MSDELNEELSPEELLKELEHRMKEIEATKAQLWDQGQYDPMMEEEYWDCHIVRKQMQAGEGANVADLQQKKHDGIIAAQQQMHKLAAK